jgi:integrase
MSVSKSELYRPTQRHPKTGERYQSAVWWMTYFVRGERQRESTGETDRAAALVKLQRKKLDLAQEANYSIMPGRVPISQLLDLLLKEYARQGRRTLYDARCKVEAQLRPFFKMRAADLTSEDIEAYQDQRLDEGIQPASINRELALVRRAFNLGARRTPPLVLRVPYFPMLPENNVRSSFLDWPFYRAMRDQLPQRVRLLFVLAFHVGTRRIELLRLEWDQVEFARGVLKLAPMETKNNEPRTLPFYGDMREYLRNAWESRPEGATLIFTEEDGEALGQFRKSWNTARNAAGVQDLLFHDLRRTAVRNMMDAGLTEHEAMNISGHLTDSVFRRYDIIDEKRLATAAEKMNTHFQARLAGLVESAPAQPANPPRPRRRAKVVPMPERGVA